MRMNSLAVILVVLAIPPALSIKCFQCAEFDAATATGDQKVLIVGLLTSLNLTICASNSTAVDCNSVSTACNTLEGKSKLGGATYFNAKVKTCNGAMTPTVQCGGINLAAATNFNTSIEDCTGKACSKDSCNSASSTSLSAVMVLCAVVVAHFAI